jgi:capsular polysaccharide biosynthesis protein
LTGVVSGVSLLEYLRVLIMRGWILAMCAVLGAGAMFAISQRQTVVYRSTMQVIFEPAAANQGVSAAVNSLLRSYVVRVHTTAVAAEIVNDLGMGIPADALKGGTEISAVPDQSLIKIEVNDTDGDWANVVALAWGQKLIDQQNALNSELPATEQLRATMHDTPRYVLFRPRTLPNVLLGSTAGLLAGMILVFILERRMTRVIRNRQDVMHVPVLVAVPRDSA